MGKNNKRYTYEEVKKIVEDKGYELISDEYANARTKLIFKDKEGYYYSSTLETFKIASPNKFHKSNPYVIENIKLWGELNNKKFELVSDKYIKGTEKLKWKCLKDGCGEIFEMNWNSIYFQSSNCPYCCIPAKKVGESNCLATKRPDLISEWHHTKNGELTPYMVTCGSNQKVWWRCEKGHEWETRITHRAIKNTNCPYCTHNFASNDYNLFVINPELCGEWNYEKNNILPTEICPNSDMKVWWKCSECDYEWQATVGSRNIGRDCPKCSKYKREDIYTQIEENFILNNYNTIIDKELAEYLQRSEHSVQVKRLSMGLKKELPKAIYDSFNIFFRKRILRQWKKDSAKNCNYKCIFTGKKFHAIHHLYGLNLIIGETFNKIQTVYNNIDINKCFEDYTDNELEIINNVFCEIHSKYPLGICLSKEIHELFHNIYGRGNNTPEQFEEFKQRYYKGEFNDLISA